MRRHQLGRPVAVGVVAPGPGAVGVGAQREAAVGLVVEAAQGGDRRRGPREGVAVARRRPDRARPGAHRDAGVRRVATVGREIPLDDVGQDQGARDALPVGRGEDVVAVGPVVRERVGVGVGLEPVVVYTVAHRCEVACVAAVAGEHVQDVGPEVLGAGPRAAAVTRRVHQVQARGHVPGQRVDVVDRHPGAAGPVTVRVRDLDPRPVVPVGHLPDRRRRVAGLGIRAAVHALGREVVEGEEAVQRCEAGGHAGEAGEVARRHRRERRLHAVGPPGMRPVEQRPLPTAGAAGGDDVLVGDVAEVAQTLDDLVHRRLVLGSDRVGALAAGVGEQDHHPAPAVLHALGADAGQLAQEGLGRGVPCGIARRRSQHAPQVGAAAARTDHRQPVAVGPGGVVAGREDQREQARAAVVVDAVGLGRRAAHHRRPGPHLRHHLQARRRAVRRHVLPVVPEGHGGTALVGHHPHRPLEVRPRIGRAGVVPGMARSLPGVAVVVDDRVVDGLPGLLRAGIRNRPVRRPACAVPERDQREVEGAEGVRLLPPGRGPAHAQHAAASAHVGRGTTHPTPCARHRVLGVSAGGGARHLGLGRRGQWIRGTAGEQGAPQERQTTVEHTASCAALCSAPPM